MRIPTLLAGPLLACLLTSCANSPTRTETVEVPVEVTIPLRAELTADVAPPPRPPLKCTDAGVPTLCTADLVDWLNGYDAVVQELRERLAEIRGLQPKE